MKFIATLSFGILIFLLTCTENVHELVFYQQLHFQFNPHPDFNPFLNFTGYPFGSPTYFTQKIGHGMCFFLFSLLLSRVANKILIVIPISIGYALITEIAQVYFSRTGCLLDVFYDSVGIFSYFALRVLLSQKKYYPIEPNG
ncbi:VanZ family protein [Rossellomorea vietnamensis]|uniref:VanZ family protein n=1 Tax=Rossellomorea vietnamensis TaxID=218284 RepID=UPI00077CD49F